MESRNDTLNQEMTQHSEKLLNLELSRSMKGATIPPSRYISYL